MLIDGELAVKWKAVVQLQWPHNYRNDGLSQYTGVGENGWKDVESGYKACDLYGRESPYQLCNKGEASECWKLWVLEAVGLAIETYEWCIQMDVVYCNMDE